LDMGRWWLAALFCWVGVAEAAPHVRVSATATPRERFAAARLERAVAKLPGKEEILLATRHDALLAAYDAKIPDFWPEAKEAFVLRRLGDTVVVAGYDTSGVLYGAMELADRIAAAKGIPAELDFEDHPALKLRGAVIGMQKPEITYDGGRVCVLLRQGALDEVSGWAGDAAGEHAVSVERPSVYFVAEVAEISGGSGASDGPAGREYCDVRVADGGSGSARDLGAAGVLQHSSFAYVCEGAWPAESSFGAVSAGE
jgi:hypothetical protein